MALDFQARLRIVRRLLTKPTLTGEERLLVLVLAPLGPRTLLYLLRREESMGRMPRQGSSPAEGAAGR